MPVVRAAVVRVVDPTEELVGVRAAAGLVVVVVVVAGFLAAAVELAVLSGRVFPGLPIIELVRREAVPFFSSSLALTLGRLRWLDAEVAAVADRRTVEAGGRVGGLVSPPVARVVPVVLGVVLEATEDVTPGRRVVAVAVVPGRLGAVVVVFAEPLGLEGVPGVDLTLS